MARRGEEIPTQTLAPSSPPPPGWQSRGANASAEMLGLHELMERLPQVVDPGKADRLLKPGN
jgi:hypothetical protein